MSEEFRSQRRRSLLSRIRMTEEQFRSERGRGRGRGLRQTIDDLPESLVLEILHRLDFKSAMRCRSVSKEWCSVVSDPSFARYFVNRSIVDHHHCPFTLLLQYHAP
nr:f-box protein [Quercus suber]